MKKYKYYYCYCNSRNTIYKIKHILKNDKYKWKALTGIYVTTSFIGNPSDTFSSLKINKNVIFGKKETLMLLYNKGESNV